MNNLAKEHSLNYVKEASESYSSKKKFNSTEVQTSTDLEKSLDILVPFMYQQAFLQFETDQKEKRRLMYYVRNKVFSPNVENLCGKGVLERARLLALMKRQVNYKYYMSDIWDQY